MIELLYSDRIRELHVRSHSKVASEKILPVFLIDDDAFDGPFSDNGNGLSCPFSDNGHDNPFPLSENGHGKKEHVFKPLSRTKPLTTSLFPVAEEYWSGLISQFADAPRYRRAVCRGLCDAVPKYYDEGSLVPVVTGRRERLVSLYDWYMEHPDAAVDIAGYENYCMAFYDYVPFFDASPFRDDPSLAEGLAEQVLLSVLKGDENFHYENVQFILDEGGSGIRLAPMLDHEFSMMFLFHDRMGMNVRYMQELIGSINGGAINRNITLMKERFPALTGRFCEFISSLREDVPHICCKGGLAPSNSFSFLAGEARHKEHDEKRAKELEAAHPPQEMDAELSDGVVRLEVGMCIDALLEALDG